MGEESGGSVETNEKETCLSNNGGKDICFFSLITALQDLLTHMLRLPQELLFFKRERKIKSLSSCIFSSASLRNS